jgi:hypothetical protein
LIVIIPRRRERPRIVHARATDFAPSPDADKIQL